MGHRQIEQKDIAPSAGTYVSGTYSDANGSRAYKLYIPSAREESSPLIVMLHGCRQSADDFATGTRMNFAAEEQGCFVVYPEQPQAANASKCWNWFRPGDQTRERGEPALIAGVTRQIIAEHKIDPHRIYVAGLSAGGAAAAIMGEAYPDLFSAVGVHSGLACGSAHDLASAFGAMKGQATRSGRNDRRSGAKAMPTIVFHGDRDATVHPCNGSKVIARALAEAELQSRTERGISASGDSFSRYVQHDSDGRRILELWELHGAGHAWSGGSSAGSFTNPSGPDATREMISFFLEHRR
jgi:poly(hydroxyalkanoate) depolymerase family esterase